MNTYAKDAQKTDKKAWKEETTKKNNLDYIQNTESKTQELDCSFQGLLVLCSKHKSEDNFQQFEFFSHIVLFIKYLF